MDTTTARAAARQLGITHDLSSLVQDTINAENELDKYGIKLNLALIVRLYMPIMVTYNYQNIMASSAVQQSVNGLYRSVELLEKITLYFDGDSII